MRSNKRYTNQTFTKRVDHEGGLHRASLNPKEPAACERCGAVYEKRRWRAKADVSQLESFEKPKPYRSTVCPACRQIEQHIVGGYVSLSGEFLRAHREEIENLLKNEEKRAAEDNPLSKIIDWRKEKGDRLLIETTTEHLAQRFGSALERTYSGEVRYDFSHENKVARVNWHRD